MKKETFDVKGACEAQRKFVDGKNYPHFAPFDGVCFDCRQNIYRQITNGKWKSGYSVERASSELITGCPHCHYSYCE